jgi:glutamate carboxypeptidase
MRYIDQHHEDMIRRLKEIVDIDSGSYSKAGIDRVGEIMAVWLREIGMDVQVIYQDNLGCHLIGRRQGRGEKKLLLVGHLDTVFDEGTAQERPFTIRDERAYGPGVSDMKGGLISTLYALAALWDSGWEHYGEVTVIMNGDEEIGSHTSEEIFVREGKKADAAFVMEPGRADGSVVSARKGVGGYEVIITGKAAHAGVEPEKGASAIEELAHKILDLHRLTDLERGTTLNVGVIKGGTRSNVVAENAYAKVDLRVRTKEEGARIAAAVAEIGGEVVVAGTETRILGGLSRPPMVKDYGVETLCGIVQEAAALVGFDVKDTATGGGSDGNFIAALGTPVVDGMGPVGGLVHSDQEYMELKSLSERCKMLALTMLLYSERFEDNGGSRA